MSSTMQQETESLESMIKTLEQQLSTETNISPYMTAIQSLKGQKPGEKYRELNYIVKKVVRSNAQRNNGPASPELSQEISPAMVPLVRILVGSELKSNDAVLLALKSEDKTVVNKALKAKWFFDASNSIVEANFFLSYVMPYVSALTRYKIIKILSRSLVGADKTAEDFYIAFLELYGLKEALPLLPACRENFIFDEILKHKINLTHNMLLVLYRRYPNLVIRYLELGNTKNKDNEKERKIHSINLRNYNKFLPYLIKNHVHEFIRFYNSTDTCLMVSCGSTVTSHFFKSALNILIDNPKYFLEIWSMKDIYKRLTIEQFEKMYGNLFPDNINEFEFKDMLEYLKYYPQEKRLNLLTSKYRLKYNKDLVENIKKVNTVQLNLVYNLISVELYEKLFLKLFPLYPRDINIPLLISALDVYPKEKRYNLLSQSFQLLYGKNIIDDINAVMNEHLLKLMPHDLRASQAKRIIDTCDEKSPAYYNWYLYMPPNESFPIFQEVIKKSANESVRIEYLQKMLRSCTVYNSKEGLLKFLQYYNMRHKNESHFVLVSVIHHISRIYGDLYNLNRSHWNILLEILQRANVKNQLINVNFFNLEPIFDAALHYLLIQKKEECEEMVEEENQNFSDGIFNLILDYNLIGYEYKWNYLVNISMVTQKYVFEKLLNLLPIRYPNDHSIWSKQKGIIGKLKVVLPILESFQYFNTLYDTTTKKSKESTQNVTKMSIWDYPWLMEMIKEISTFSAVDNSRNSKIKKLKKILMKEEPKFYCSISQSSDIDNIFDSEIKTGRAWITLKKNESEIMNNWTKYLIECRRRLQCNSKCGGLAARRFLLTVRWYKDLPLKFIERCLQEIKEAGSIKVLSVLLEGESFGKIVTPFAPPESTLNVTRGDSKDYYKIVQAILPAMNITNPPVPFDLIAIFCQGDYVRLTVQTFTNISQKVSKEKIMAFARNLVKQKVSVKRHGVRLLFKIANKDELNEFVKKIWQKEKHISIRELIAKLVYQRFVDVPSSENWELVTICIDGLNEKDEIAFNVFCNVQSIKNVYAPQYVNRLLSKIEGFTNDEIDEKSKATFLCAVLNSFTVEVINYLGEEVILELLDKYYFETNSSEISSAAQNFAKQVFGRPYVKK